MKNDIEVLIALADALDRAGQTEEADEVDATIKQLEENGEPNMTSKLAEVANRLDAVGAIDEADMIDGFIQKYAKTLDYIGEGNKTEQSKRYDSKYHHKQQVNDPKTEKVEKHEMIAAPLQTRNCPDHVGVPLGRIGEGNWQCPIDGAKYNWREGFKMQNGQEIRGGKVEEQTPDTTDFESNKIFEDR